MVEFNGERITEVAKVGILDIKVSTPPLTITTRNIPARDGQRFVRKTYGPRQVTVSFTIEVKNIDKRVWFIDRLNEWLSPREPCKLYVNSMPMKYLLAVCTKNITPSTRDWWEDLSITFTAYDPFFTSDFEKKAPMNAEFVVSGPEPPAWRIEQQSAETLLSPRWECAGKHIELSGYIAPSGLVIDAEKRTIQNNLESLITRLTLDSDFFELSPGRNQIITANGASGMIFWRERTI